MFSPVLLIGVILIATATKAEAKKCERMRFYKCLGEVKDFSDGYTFDIRSATELNESCAEKQMAINCVREFVSMCMTKTEQDVLMETTGGQLRFLADLCHEGTDINTGYLKNIDCWEKIEDDTEYCNDMFEESQQKLFSAEIEERLKLFHKCCSFDWHRQCKVKAAEVKCREEAKDFVEHTSNILGAQILSKMCESTYPSCHGHGLYGMEVEDLDERYSKMATDSAMRTSKNMLFAVALILFHLLV